MIKRTYFMVFKKTHGSRYAENSLTITVKSWLPDISSAFEEGIGVAEKNLRDQPGESVFCSTFNRL